MMPTLCPSSQSVARVLASSLALSAFCACALPFSASAQSSSNAPSPDSLIAQGRVAEALEPLQQQFEKNPQDHKTDRKLAFIALWQNRLDDAAERFERLVQQFPKDTLLKDGLSETYFRLGQYSKAAPIYKSRKSEGSAILFSQPVDFYQISIPDTGTVIPFHSVGTLEAVIPVVINGHTFYLTLDTGAHSLLLDSAAAAKAGITSVGSTDMNFAGGVKLKGGVGIADSIRIGAAELKNVPVWSYSRPGKGHRSDGLIGIAELRHFRMTINYPRRRLTLMPRESTPSYSESASEIPMLMLASHKPSIPVIADGRDTTIMILDSGFSGVYRMGPSPSMVKRLGVVLDTTLNMNSSGGGGAIDVIPFNVPSLEAGPVQRKNVPAVAGVYPGKFEKMEGLRVGGLLAGLIFEDRQITLDFERMKLVVEKGL